MTHDGTDPASSEFRSEETTAGTDSQEGETDTAKAAADARALEEVERVFMAMPEITRSIFIARRFHELSIAEICRQTGLSHAQVMRQLAKAVEHIHRAFGGRT